ncbi:MAG: hypothetical protein MSG64_12300 [Pyrinomonadaceae bacterium MAG19_C2-C3]|nr:hypothetical protein [Pyrinomonadaceae bacterium MAG19_C2-C3]
MDEEPTQQLTDFEQRVLAELSSINARLTMLEDKVERRLHDTRPMWEVVIVQLREMRERVDKIDSRIGELLRELFETRTRVAQLEERQRTPAA